MDIHAGDVQEITAVKDDAERDLAQAQPALDAALVALNSITPKDISGLKALKNPPDVVKRIFDCVLLLRCASLSLCQGNVRGPLYTYHNCIRIIVYVS